MKEDWHKKVLQKKLNRKEFLQFMGASMMVLLGLGNLMALIRQMNKSPETISQSVDSDPRRGFGSRKFGA